MVELSKIMAESYENLEVWEQSVELASRIYEVTRDFPEEEKYGITSQLRRAAISISANIAEGSGRESSKEFSRFIGIAVGSLNEVESLIHVSKKLGYIDDKKFDDIIQLVEEVGNLCGGFRKYLRKQEN